MPEGKIVLKFRIGDADVQLEGSRNDILEIIEKDLTKIVEGLTKIPKIGFPTTSKTEMNQHIIQPATPQLAEPFPSIQAKSCAEAIVNLLSSEWGRTKPRSISEIRAALEVNALHYSEKVIGFTLTRLTKKQKLRRWKTESGFVYTTIS